MRRQTVTTTAAGSAAEPAGAGPASRGARLESIRTLGLALAVGATTVFALASLGVIDLPATLRDIWLYNAVYLGAGTATAVCAVRDRSARVAWVLITLSMATNAAGNVYYSVSLKAMQEPPYPSWADAGYLLSYPLIYIALMLLLRQLIRRRYASLWLDGLIVALASAALAVAFLVAPLVQLTDGELAVVATDLAYPLGDVLLVSTVSCGMWLLGRRLSWTWAILGAALLAYGVGDVAYLLRDAAGEYVEGTLLDATWLIAVTLMALAACLHRDPAAAEATDPAATRRMHGVLVSVPLLGALASLGLLLPWSDTAFPPLAKWLAGSVVCLAVVRSGLTYREMAVWELGAARRLAATDELTGLRNRRGFTVAAEAVLARAEGSSTRALSGPLGGAAAERPGVGVGLPGSTALVVLDLDGFKEVNDSLGHQAGDLLLIEIGRRLSDTCRESTDLVARLGGDEFALLLPASTRGDAQQVAHRVGRALAAPFILEGVKVAISASIGIALAQEHGRTLQVLMRHADMAMYHAKENRLGAVVYDAQDHGTPLDDRVDRLDELRAAIDHGELVVHYQPKVHLATDRVTGVEALVRWQHPSKGLLAPADFLPVVEELGLMPTLTATVLDEALAQAALWRRQGLPLTMSVNLTAAEVVDSSLPGRIEELLARHDMPPSSLQLEITEETLLGDRIRAREVLGRLRAMGVGISIDDYGSGYSSLAYLRELTVDELKLDRSFVSPMVGDARAAAIVRSTIDLAHSLGLNIVAEGVEHAAAADDLLRYGCDIAQGFYYTKALTPEEFTRWLAARGSLDRLAAGNRTDATYPDAEPQLAS